jgi:hypothetical protein
MRQTKCLTSHSASRLHAEASCAHLHSSAAFQFSLSQVFKFRTREGSCQVYGLDVSVHEADQKDNTIAPVVLLETLRFMIYCLYIHRCE